ncbi:MULTISPECIES: flavodoxin family protein [Methanobrevibacter]|jgi:flavodoxin|uniref:Flavodoxin n=2 Tax=Methanobrevibacter TaxID=2172 RepID=A0A315XKE4_9EURY|nr:MULTISPECIES: flavodoxin family protein [Methanobrevibacter]ADC46215.1 flavodoxin [Methanobrevibacter ruminantium M1]MBE6490761.1 flavodoxin [Methanobrevibacter sp.]MBE6498827.1 flavodoxin [Methanobrevibacter sp.]MBR3155672.1 flavodoxin [Methanobrevibacter sp.]MEE0902360.1 flavodoxin family protein [Methanobrevibacter sp.]
MKIAIRYYSKTGNTEKLAEAIGEAIGVAPKTIDEPLNEDVDILFLGNSVYNAGADSKVKEFLKNIDVNVGSIVNVSSAALIESTYKQIKKEAEKCGLNMDDREFHCRGQFKFVHRGHPNEEDINEAVNFAKSIVR